MFSGRKKPVLLFVVVTALALLLPLLAYLQYDWLGKVSEREREQMLIALRRTLSQFRQHFDREITRVFTQFSGPPLPAEHTAEEYAKVLRHWNTTAPYPKLIRDIFFEEPSPNGAATLRKLNVSSTAWEPADWIKEFGPQRVIGDPVDGGIPAVAIPVIRMLQAKQSPGRPAVPPFAPPIIVARIIVRLDLEYIKNEFVPALIRQDFADLITAYKIQISAREDDTRILYSSTPGQLISTTPDGEENLLAVRPDEYRSLMPVTFSVAGGSPAIALQADRLFSFSIPPGIKRVVRGPIDVDAGVWNLRAVHNSGSLNAAVGQLRYRNLALSLSILALLASSIAIILHSAAKAELLARQQMEFVSTVSHELRTPLAVICSAGENLADGVVRDSEQVKSYGKVIRKEGRRLAEMVEHVLSFAEIQSGPKYTLVPVELAAVVERAVDMFEVPIRENGFTVESQIAQDVPTVMADAPALTRAVQNLISNAIKYSGSSRWIGISAFREDGWAKIAVQDRGGGVASSDAPRLFEPFFRGRLAVDNQIHGSGLGLSLVKNIVDAHHGKIEFTSNTGNGSTFCIVLPEIPKETP